MALLIMMDWWIRMIFIMIATFIVDIVLNNLLHINTNNQRCYKIMPVLNTYL